MEYRLLPHSGEKISILGLGTSSIQESSEKQIEEAISYAVDNGINYFDMASAEAKPFAAYGRALASCRNKVYFKFTLAPTMSQALMVGLQTLIL